MIWTSKETTHNTNCLDRIDATELRNICSFLEGIRNLFIMKVYAILRICGSYAKSYKLLSKNQY